MPLVVKAVAIRLPFLKCPVENSRAPDQSFSKRCPFAGQIIPLFPRTVEAGSPSTPRYLGPYVAARLCSICPLNAYVMASRTVDMLTLCPPLDAFLAQREVLHDHLSFFFDGRCEATATQAGFGEELAL
jgi:hypothetical protein